MPFSSPSSVEIAKTYISVSEGLPVYHFHSTSHLAFWRCLLWSETWQLHLFECLLAFEYHSICISPSLRVPLELIVLSMTIKKISI